MRIEVSCLFHLDQHHDVVRDELLGDGVRMQEVITGEPYDWLRQLREENELFRAVEELNAQPYTHRLFVAVEGVEDVADARVEDARQLIIQAIILSRIVRPASIAWRGNWVASAYDDDGGVRHHPEPELGFGTQAYSHAHTTTVTITRTDARRIADLWEPLKRLVGNEEKYRRIVRALKYFYLSFYIMFVEFRHLILHSALEALICTRAGSNRQQIIQRLPQLVPGLTQDQARDIYRLCCDLKHSAAPLQLSPAPGVRLMATDAERYEAFRQLERAVRFLLERALSDADFADLLADRSEFRRTFPISTKQGISDIGNLIVRVPEIRGGRPILTGTGVTVHRIVGWYKLGLSPEEIANQFGHLSLAQVHAALTYYHANHDEIEAEIAAEEDEGDRLAEEHYLSHQSR